MKRIAIGIALLMSAGFVHAANRSYASYADAVKLGASSPVATGVRTPVVVLWAPPVATSRDLKSAERVLLQQINQLEKDLIRIRKISEESWRDVGAYSRVCELEAELDDLQEALSNIQEQEISQ